MRIDHKIALPRSSFTRMRIDLYGDVLAWKQASLPRMRDRPSFQYYLGTVLSLLHARIDPKCANTLITLTFTHARIDQS